MAPPLPRFFYPFQRSTLFTAGTLCSPCQHAEQTEHRVFSSRLRLTSSPHSTSSSGTQETGDRGEGCKGQGTSEGGGRMFTGQRQVHTRSCTRMQYFDKFFLEHSNDNIGSVTCMPTESCTHLICFLFLIYIQLLCHCHYIFLCWLKPGLQWRRN